MKSLTKYIYTLTGLAAMLLLSCSKEDRYLCSDNDPTPLTTRSVVSLDSLNSGELVLLEETEELLKLKNLMARKRSSNVGAMAVGVSDVDEFFASNMNAISGMSVNISVRSISSGSSTTKKYLKCSGNGKEVTLDELSESDESKFYLKILPASSGIPYLIYSNKSRTPLCVGHYSNSPDDKILMAAAEDSESLYSSSWDLIPSSYYKGYFSIQSESYFGQSDPDNPWSVFNYVLEAKSNNKLGYGQRVANKPQQEFLIKPITKFDVKSIEYDLANATVTSSTVIQHSSTAVNTKEYSDNVKIDMTVSGDETSVYYETPGTLSIDIESGTRRFQRPVPIAGRAVIPEGTQSDATYSRIMQKHRISWAYSTSIEMKPRCLLELTTKFRTFVLNVPYVVTAVRHREGGRISGGSGRSRGRGGRVEDEEPEVKVRGNWRGYAIANPEYSRPINEPRFFDLDTGDELNYSLVYNENHNSYEVM